MWEKLKNILGYAWAAPVTLLGLIYTGVFSLLGWYEWHGIEGHALVWVVDYTLSPKFFLELWNGWSGHAVGNVVVLRVKPSSTITLKHEQKHVDQCMRLGVFHPIVYFLSWLAIKIGCPGSNAYYSNPFEIDARRHAGQMIDIEGAIKKMNERKR